MVKYHFFKEAKEADKKADQIRKGGHHATVFNFGKPSKKGMGWRVHEYKRKLPKEFL